MTSEEKGNSFRITFPMLLGLLFVGLKLTNHIDWSWWWVTSPFWIPIVAVLCVFCAAIVVVLLVAGLMAACGKDLPRLTFRKTKR